MHEFSLCQSMIRIVDAAMAGRPGVTLLRIFVDVGRGSTVEPLLLKDAFAILAAGGPYENAELVLNEIPLVGECRGCGKRFEYHELALGCPDCGGTRIDIVSGLELGVREIEIED